jgi:hypothetical protein
MVWFDGTNPSKESTNLLRTSWKDIETLGVK